MYEELTGAGGGVGAPPAAEPTAQAQGVGEAQGEAATAGQPQPATAPEPTRVNLDDLPEFREWKSRYDSRQAQMQAELQQARQSAEAAQRQADEARRQWEMTQLQDRPPEEVAAYYQQEMAKRDAEYRQREAQQREAQEVYAEADRMLKQAGLTPEHPGLDWSGGQTRDGLVRLANSVTGILAAQVQELSKSQKTQVEQAKRQAGQQALQQAGVTQVSTATGGPTASLQREWDQVREQYKHSGDTDGYIRAKQEFRKRGLDV